MEYNETLSNSWSNESNWSDPIFGSAKEYAELSSRATPISKKLANVDLSQIDETPPTINNNDDDSSNIGVSIGKKIILKNDISASNLPSNLKNSVIETPKRFNRRYEDMQTPREPKNERYPSPSPSNKSFSLNFHNTPQTPITPKTPKNSYNLKSPGIFSTPRVISGRIASPCSHKTFEALTKVLDPEIFNICKNQVSVKQEYEADDDDLSHNSNKILNDNEMANSKHESSDSIIMNNDYFNNENSNSDSPEEEMPEYNNTYINEYNAKNGEQNDPLNQNNEEYEQEDSIKEGYNQTEISFEQYFNVDATPSKIYRTSRLQDIMNHETDIHNFDDLLHTQRISFNEMQKKDDNEIENDSINMSNNSEEVQQKNDATPKYDYRTIENRTENGDVSIFKYRVIENDPNKISFQSIPQMFNPEISNLSPKKSERSYSKKLEDSINNSKHLNFEIKNDENNTNENCSILQDEKNSNEIFKALKKDDELNNEINKNDSIQNSISQTPVFVPDVPEPQQDSISQASPIFVPNASKPQQESISEVAPVFVPDLPESRPNPIQNNQNESNQKQEEDSTSTKSQQSSSLQSADHIFEQRVFMKLLSVETNDADPRIKVKDIGTRGITPPSLKKAEGSASNSPHHKKEKSIQIMPNRQLKCTANKKSARYIMEEGELTMIIGDKQYIVHKGGMIDLIKGKDIILMNNSNEPATIIKTTRT